MKEMSLIQVMVLSPVRVYPGLQLTSTTVPTMTGNVLVVVMSDTAAGSSVHVSVVDTWSLLKCFLWIISAAILSSSSTKQPRWYGKTKISDIL